jgi:hypothetical protein
MNWMATPIALPLVGVQLRAARRHVFGDEATAHPCVRVVAHPQALLARLARDHTDERRPIVGIRAMALALIAASAWRVAGLAMRCACFPPRSGTTRLPQRRCPPSYQWGRWHSAGSGCAVGGYGAVCATAPVRVRGGRSVPPWPFHAAALAWPVVGEFSRGQSLSTACSSRRRRDNDRPESGLARGTAVAPCSDNAGIVGHLGAGGVPARECRYDRQAVQQSRSQL